MRASTTESLQLSSGSLIPIGHVFLMCALALAATAWGGVLIAGPENHQIQVFLIVLGVFGAASAAFVGSRMRFGQFRFFDLPIFVTVLAFAEFGLAPLGCLLTGTGFEPTFHNDYELLVHSLVLVLVGFTSFWAGAHILSRIRRASGGALANSENTVPSPPIDRPIVCAVMLYCAAFTVKAYLLQNFGFGYGASQQVYLKHLAALQVANVIFQLGTCALIILAIEKSFYPLSLERKVLFWLVFVPECFWGLLSGMKGTLLQNFLLVAVISSLARRRLKKSWLLAALLGLVIVYPFSMRYRELIRSRPQEVMDLSGAVQISGLAFDEARDDAATESWLATGTSATLSRLNLLQSFALVMSLGPQARMMQGDERWWMLPVYPFVPRFLWRTKPALDKTRRFSVALGYGDQTSTAITYPGDLYFDGRLPALLLGMFVFGLVAQWLTARFAVPGKKPALFVYTGMFITVFFVIELDAFNFWCTLIRTFVLLNLVAWTVYPRSCRLLQTRS